MYVVTASGYLCCPMGHRRLIRKIDWEWRVRAAARFAGVYNLQQQSGIIDAIFEGLSRVSE
jgi:hypothetical protein